jgi:hypothetical protein
MRERGRYQLQLMKTRSSSGVGMKVDLEFDLETLRITDPGEEAQESGLRGVGANNILSQIKTSSSVSLSEDTPNVSASVDSSKLKSMLAGLKKVE